MIVVRVVLFTLIVVGGLVLAFALAGWYVDFLDVSFVGLLIVIGFLIIWAGALYDMWRRSDLSTSSRILWTLLVIILPVIGSLVYVLARPSAERITYRGEQNA